MFILLRGQNTLILLMPYRVATGTSLHWYCEKAERLVRPVITTL